MKERMRKGSDEKRELEKLNEQVGPFTSGEEVDAYLSDLDETNMNEKKMRMKLEISYARDGKGVRRGAGGPLGQEGGQEGHGLLNFQGVPDQDVGLNVSLI